jgi:hypothetical protein
MSFSHFLCRSVSFLSGPPTMHLLEQFWRWLCSGPRVYQSKSSAECSLYLLITSLLIGSFTFGLPSCAVTSWYWNKDAFCGYHKYPDVVHTAWANLIRWDLDTDWFKSIFFIILNLNFAAPLLLFTWPSIWYCIWAHEVASARTLPTSVVSYSTYVETRTLLRLRIETLRTHIWLFCRRGTWMVNFTGGYLLYVN